MTGYMEGSNNPLDRTSFVATAGECNCHGERSREQYTDQKRNRCRLYSVVKAYIHHVHRKHITHDPSLSQADDHQLLLSSEATHQGCCFLHWKPLMWMGVILILFGVLMILAGNLIPPLRVLIESYDHPELIYQKVDEYSAILGMWEFTGLILLCTGGVILAAALLAPPFLTRFCLNQTDNPEVSNQRITRTAAFNPLEVIAPISSTLINIQSTKLANGQIQAL